VPAPREWESGARLRMANHLRNGGGVMLVLSRKVGERILIGDHVAVTIVRVSQGTVRIGIEAPKGMPIVREEIKHQRQDVAEPGTLPSSG
jgi:carbon storage regulator